MVANVRERVDQLHGRRRQRDDTRLARLAALAGNADLVALNFRPAQGADLVAPSSSQYQQLDRRSERPCGFCGGLPHRRELSRIQYPVAFYRAPGLGQVRHRIGFEDSATDSPAEQAMQVRM